MTLTPTDIPEVLVVSPVRHVDDRGSFSETFRSEWFPGLQFVQDNQSMSAALGTLRGLHFQSPPWAQDKLIRVLRGAILDVAVDIRHGSPTFREHVAVELSAENWLQLLVPKGFAHGFVTLSPDTEVAYKVTDFYSPEHDLGLAWDDAELGIDWGVADPILSDRDREHPTLNQLPEYFRI